MSQTPKIELLMPEADAPIAPPSCPSCEGPMILRTNRKDGNSFWGCRSFPACRGTRDADWDSQESDDERPTESQGQVRVVWNDATLDRRGWQCRYTTAGGRLRSSPATISVSAEFRQCWVARTPAKFVASEAVRRVTGAVRKLIQRGSNPPIHPDSELGLLHSWGLSEQVRPSALPGDLSVQLDMNVFQELASQGLRLPRPDFEPDEEVRLGSGLERDFVFDWVRDNLGPDAPDGSPLRRPLMP